MLDAWSGVSTYGKRLLELALPRGVRAERVAGRRHPRAVEADQVGGDLLDVAAGPGLGLVPVRAAEPVDRGGFAADVLGDLVELVGRHVEPVGRLAALARGVLDDEVLAGRAADGALDHLDEPAHPVLLVHDVVTRAQRKGVDLVAATGRHTPHVAGGALAGLAGEVQLGDDGELRRLQQEPAAERPRGQVDPPGRELGRVGRCGDVVVGEDLADALGQAGALGDDQDGPAVGDPRLDGGDGRFGVAAEGRDVGGAEVDVLGLVVVLGQLGVGAVCREAPPRHTEASGVLAQLGEGPVRSRAELGLQVDRDVLARRRGEPGRFEELPARGDHVVGPGADAFGLVEDDEGALGQHVEQGLHAVGERRAQRLHAFGGDALGDLAEQVRHAGQLGGERLGALAHLRGEQQLAARRRPQPVLGDLEAALVGDLEPADLLDRVAPELDAQRVLLGRREHVEDAAAHREVPAPLDEVGACVGGVGEGLDDLVEGALVAGLEGDRGEVAEALDDRLQGRADRGDDDAQRPVCRVVRVGVGQAAQHGEPAADRVGARAEPLVRQGLPARGRWRRRSGRGSSRGLG